TKTCSIADTMAGVRISRNSGERSNIDRCASGHLAARPRLRLGLRARRRCRRDRADSLAKLLRLLSQQAELAEAAVDHCAHYFHHLAVVDALVASDEHALVGLLVVHRLEFAREVREL